MCEQLKDEADKIATTMDLHSVRLKFETFVDRNGFLEPFSPPVYSHAIHNLSTDNKHQSKSYFLFIIYFFLSFLFLFNLESTHAGNQIQSLLVAFNP